jgi:hypothetical protein
MKWITRQKPIIDRVACCWLLKRFVDKEAEFIFAPIDQVMKLAEDLDAIPFDMPNVEYTHEGEMCTFDFIIKKHNLKDPALFQIAEVVRGADTGRPDLAPQVPGLWAISAGLSYNLDNDGEMLEICMKIYDALYSWAKYMLTEINTWSVVLKYTH